MTHDEEKNAVRELGEMIGYGRVMQLCEQIWDRKVAGAALSVGPCTSTLIRCPHPESGRDEGGHCDWCCGSGRITRRVMVAIAERGR